MASANDIWIPTPYKVEIMGKKVQINGIINKKTKETIIDLAEIARKEMEILAEQYGLNSRNLSELLLLYAPCGNFEVKDKKIRNKYTFNKMLFYLKQELKKKNLDSAFPIDEFGKGRAGPIPIHLHEDLEELKEKGLIDYAIIKDGKKIDLKGKKLSEIKGPIGSKECKLTKEGEKIAKALWNKIGVPVIETVLKIKKEIYPLSPEELKKKVHKDFPEYKMNYTDLDTEDF